MSLFSMLGSVFSGRRDYTTVTSNAPVQTEPYDTDCAGFNTRFSLHDLECKVNRGVKLTPSEQKFYDYVKSRNN